MSSKPRPEASDPQGTSQPVNFIMAKRDAHFPGRPAIDSYGNGGFRFADMSHRGSLLFLPSGVWGWSAVAADDLVAEDFETVFDISQSLEFILLGCGPNLVMPSAALVGAFSRNGIGLEPMTTGAAARTYNVLLAENRRVGAALIAVE